MKILLKIKKKILKKNKNKLSTIHLILIKMLFLNYQRKERLQRQTLIS